MVIRVLAFARLREILGGSVLALDLPAGARAHDVWAALLRDHSSLNAERATTRIARNGRIVPFDSELADGDELALLPPVGGG
jgi:molybdopterin converting factor small subunit